MVSTSDLTAAVALTTTPADVSQLIATALLPFVQQTALDAALALRDGRLDAAEALLAALQAAGYQRDLATALLGYITQGAYNAGQALQDSRLDGHDADILALQNARPYATGAELTALQVSLQSAIDGILAEIATLGGATNLVNAPAWQGEITSDLLVGTNQIRNLPAAAPLSIALANDNLTLSPVLRRLLQGGGRCPAAPKGQRVLGARHARRVLHLCPDGQLRGQRVACLLPRTELDSLLTATLTQYWTSGRTQTETWTSI